MGLFSDITSALGSVFGNSSQPSSDPNDQKKKQNTPNAPTVNNNLTAAKVNLPKVLLKPAAPLAVKPIIPLQVTQPNNANLVAQPIASAPVDGIPLVAQGSTVTNFNLDANVSHPIPSAVLKTAQPLGANAWAGISQNTPDFLHNVINAADQQRGNEIKASYVAPPETKDGALPPKMVNVSWSNTPVPYSESLNGPPENGVKPSDTPQQDLFHSLLGHVVNAAKDVGGAVGTGIPEATLKVGTGLAQGTVATANALTHGINDVPRVIAGNNSTIGQAMDKLNQQAQNATNTIEAPIASLSKAIDTTAQSGNVGARAVYKPAQIVGNVATIVPGAAEAVTKLPVVGDDIERALSKIPGVSVGKTAETAAGVDSAGLSDDTAPTATETTPPETGTKGPEEPTPTNAPTNEPGKPVPAPGATESGVKPNPDVPATTPVEPKIPVTTEPTPITPPEAAPVQTPPVEQTPQAPVEAPAPEVAAPPKAPAVAPGQAASEAVAASPEQQAVVDEAANNLPAYQRKTPTTVGEAQAQHNLGVHNAPDETFSADNRVNPAEPLPTPKTDIPSYIKKDPEAVITKAKADIAAIDKKLDAIGTPNSQKFSAKQDLAQQLKDHPNAKPAIIKGYQRRMGAYNETDVTKTKANLLIERQQAQKLIDMANDAKNLPEDTKAETAPVKAAETPKDTANVKFEQTENPLKSDEVKPQDAQPFGVKRMEANREPEEEPHQLKKQSVISKAKAIRTQLTKLGPRSREFLSDAQNKEINEQKLLTRMEKGLSVFKLSKGDQETTWDVVEGKSTSTDPKINQAADELTKRMEEVRQALNSTGENIAERPNFMPHNIDSSQFTDPKIYNQVAQGLVEKGEYPDLASAKEGLNKYRYDASQEHGGSLDSPREYNVQNYEKSNRVLHNYFKQSATRMANNMQFGKDGEVLEDQVNRAAAKGEDAENLKRLQNEVLHPKVQDDGVPGKIASGVNKGTNILFLPKAVLSHSMQGLNVATKIGFPKYLKAIVDSSFSDDDKAFLDDQGFNSDKNEAPEGNVASRALNKGTAPGIKQVLKWHSNVAAIGGKNIAEGLAARGNEAALRAMNVTGDLVRDEDGKIALTDEQKGQAAHDLVNHTIFSKSRLESPTWTNKIMGKFIGQFKKAYVFKQGGFIHGLFTDASKGNVRPLLRYLGVSVPLAGATVAGLKNVATTGRPIKPRQSVKNFASQALSDSGLGSIGGGAGNDIYSTLAYNYNNNYRYQNAANAVAPVAGAAVETGQNIESALRGYSKPLIKQGLSTLPVGGTAIENKLYPATKYTPAQQKFNTAWDANYPKAIKSLSPSFSKSANPTAIKADEKTRDIFTSMVASDHDPSTGATILKTPDQTKSQAANAVAYPKALQAYQKLEQSLPNHNPVYDLPTTATPGQPSLTTYEIYESYTKGDPNRTVLEQQNPWLINEFNKEQTFFNAQGKLSNTVEPKGYIPYPPITSAQSDMMTQLTNLSSIQNRTPAQETELNNLENNPDVQKAYTLLDNYTNANRKAEGAAPIPYPTESLTPAMNALLAKEEALPSKTGAKSALINANLTLWNQAQQIMAQTTEYAANEYGGVVQQGGKEPNLLKDQYELGQNDIAATKNADGTTTYSLNPAQAYTNSSGSGSGSSYQSASDKAYDADKAAGLSDDDEKYSTKAKVTGLKADTKKYTPPKLLADTAPTGKNGNPFVQAITTTKGVKQRKGGDNIYAANISNSKGVKTA